MLFGERGFITKTFAYLLHVLTAAFRLMAKLRETIASLVQNLYAADARNPDLEAQNRSLMEQLRINKEECDAFAQLCRLAEVKNYLHNLTATRSLAEQCEKHKKECGVLWEQYTSEIGEARHALEAEKAAHRRTLEAASMRGVSGAPQTAAIAARELALLAKINAIEAQYAAQRNALKTTHMLVVAALHAQREEQRRAFQALEAECLAAHAATERREGRFVEEWARFAPSFEAGQAWERRSGGGQSPARIGSAARQQSSVASPTPPQWAES